MRKEECTEFGQIGKTRGLKGELKFNLNQQIDQIPKQISLLYVQMASSLVPFIPESIQYQNKGGFLTFKGVNFEQAQNLVGKVLYLSLKDLPEKVFSYKDFEGFEVEDVNHGLIGIMLSIERFPQQWIGRINNEGKEILVILNQITINSYNLQQKRLFLCLPDGLLDIYNA